MQKNIVILLLTLFLFFSCELMEEIFLGEDSDPYEGYTNYTQNSGYPDADLDGIPDVAENSKCLYEGMPLYDWGARTGKRDIFIHAATMEYSGTDGGLYLQKDALDKVVAAFAAQNIALHFDVGSRGLYDGYTQSTSDTYNLSGRNNQVPYAKSIFLDGRSSHEATVSDYHNDYVPKERDYIFHLMVFGSSQELDGSNGSSGVSWCPGDEFLITLGNWGLNFNNTAMKNITTNFQAATIMHEFGHNLGLKHGGNENQNYKPNYYSIMNYLYQLTGLPDIGNVEGDRYYLTMWYEEYYGRISGTTWNDNYPEYKSYDSLKNSPYSITFKMDYSHGNGGILNEANLDEDAGLKQSGSSYVDWNGDKIVDNTLSKDINVADLYDNEGSTTELEDYNDWSNLKYYFYNLTLSGSRSIIDTIRTLEVNEKPHFIHFQ